LKVGVALKLNSKRVSAGSASIALASNDSYELTILKLARENKGILTVSEVALEAGIPIEEAKR
jgi:hypothetical protein